MKKVLVILMTICILTGCGEISKKQTQSDMIKNVMSKDNYVIVDVRTKEEYDEGHIKGAINIPHDTIDASVDLDKDMDILVYCKSGTRSKIAYDTLKSLGYNVYDMGAYETIALERE